jgi:multiple sugar transport system permease protein
MTAAAIQTQGNVTETDLAPSRRRTGAANMTPGVGGGGWRLRLVVIIIITGVVLVPIGAILGLSLEPSLGSTTKSSITFSNFVNIFKQTQVLTWLRNSLIVTLVTVVVSVAVAAPAGYVLSRGRNRLVSGYSLMLFIVQSLPVITAVIPLFILFAKFGLVDSLIGVTIIYVGSTMSVSIWMMAAYYDSIPISLEEASWIDGCSVFGSFSRIVLRNSLPGLLSTAIFGFLLAWNDYLVAVVFLRSSPNFTLPVGLETFFEQNATNWGLVMAVAVVMMLPPIIIFSVLNRYFSIGGLGGALAGQ